MSKNTDQKFRFTSGDGSALLYHGDEFVAKFSSQHKMALSAILVANEDVLGKALTFVAAFDHQNGECWCIDGTCAMHEARALFSTIETEGEK